MRRLRAQALAVASISVAGIAALAQSGNPPQVRQMRANGVELAYVEQGQGTPVVFVHGAVTDLRLWEPQRSAFASQYRFVAYSYRYHGTDPWPDEGTHYSAETHAADLVAFISALKAGPVHLVGLSYGGMLAAMVATKEPQLVRTLTLAEPGLFSLLAEHPEGKSALEQWNKGFEPVVAAIKAGDHVQATRHLAALVTGGSPDEFDKIPAGLREVLLGNARTLPLLLASAPTDITCEMLRGIKIPTLVVRGERTPGFFAKVSAAVGRCIPGSRMAVIPDASHAMSYDNPAAFNREVLEFLSGVKS